jgi:RNA methyltransferase, TrmH family
MIASPQNEKLKLVRKLRERKHREREGLFATEGEDLVEAGLATGAEPRFLLTAAGSGLGGEEVEPELLAATSSLGSGTRAIAVWPLRWSEAPVAPCIYLHGVGDPGNVGTIVRTTHALLDGPVALGPGCADPFSPKAVRASMGSVFARPPAHGEFGALSGNTIALERGAGLALSRVELEPPLVVCLGSEREGLPPAVSEEASVRAEIPLRGDGPDSLNVAMAATVALYDLTNRMAADG